VKTIGIKIENVLILAQGRIEGKLLQITLIVYLRFLAKSVRRLRSSIFNASEALQLPFEGVDHTLVHCVALLVGNIFSFR